MPPKAVDRLRIAEFRARLKNQEWVKKVLDPVWLYLHGFRQFRLKGLGKIKSPRNTVRGPVFETPEKMWLRKPLADPRQWRIFKKARECGAVYNSRRKVILPQIYLQPCKNYKTACGNAAGWAKNGNTCRAPPDG